MTLVGGDEEQRQRLAGLLAQVAGVEVTGWSDTPRSLTVLKAMSSVDVCIDAPSSPPLAELRRPYFAPRQLQVLIAYSSGNELLEVAARRAGMNAETFKTHLRRIRAKYREVGRDAPTRLDLYVRAIQDGFLSPPS
ncbi:helix-turn-helix transcriptional regulator [Blastococcus sp. TF02-09]|uniref:helix-turn-helix transcriptional regulator n=1 Tax=Blastococcus sp. TF02-09 TaxID=2250576 RepID=UPI0011BD8EA9|nr:helix-turn-helix transcriptional regulator [Blastococcus sp. TF02-9]